MPLHSFPHSCGFNISASPRLSTASCMHRHLGSISRLPLLVSETSCAHDSSLFRCLTFPSHLPLSRQFSAVTGLQYLHVPPFLSIPSCMHLVSISKFPAPSSGIHFRVPKIPPASLSIFCMYLHVSSFRFNVYRLHPLSLNNFLRSSCFNIELSLSPMCPSISCIHFASYVDFPHWPLQHFLRFSCFNTVTSRGSTTSCMHLASVLYLNSPRPVPGPKKTCTGPTKVPRPKNIQPNVSAYNNGVPLLPYGGKVHEAGARVQKTETELRNN